MLYQYTTIKYASIIWFLETFYVSEKTSFCPILEIEDDADDIVSASDIINNFHSTVLTKRAISTELL